MSTLDFRGWHELHRQAVLDIAKLAAAGALPVEVSGMLLASFTNANRNMKLEAIRCNRRFFFPVPVAPAPVAPDPDDDQIDEPLRSRRKRRVSGGENGTR